MGRRMPAEDFVRPAGWKLFWFLARENGWSMLGVNALTVLLCLPVVTAPAAAAACTEYCLLLLEDRRCPPWRSFWSAFRRHFRAAARYGLFSLALPAALLLLCGLYLRAGGLRRTAAACLAAVLVIALLDVYALPMLCRAALPVRRILGNSFRLFCAAPWRCLPPLLVRLGVLALSLRLLPGGVLVLLLAGALPARYLAAFLCRPVIQKYVIDPYYRNERT